jgi:hypothetical protein
VSADIAGLFDPFRYGGDVFRQSANGWIHLRESDSKPAHASS